jgi:CarD family transcriptional regulator
MIGDSAAMDSGVSRDVFGEGDLVVYPNHGAGHVSGVEEKVVLGELRRYYIVYIADGGLTLNIPADGKTGLRPCSDEESVAGALTTLRGAAQSMPANWNQRLKHNQEKLRSGEISRVAEVVRDLSAFGGEHGLSTGERTLLSKARRILLSEVALVRHLPVEEAEALVDGALHHGEEG